MSTEPEAPDSNVSPHQRVTVEATPEYDAPALGSVMVILTLSKNASTSLRMSRATAESLQRQLGAYLEGTK